MKPFANFSKRVADCIPASATFWIQGRTWKYKNVRSVSSLRVIRSLHQSCGLFLVAPFHPLDRTLVVFRSFTLLCIYHSFQPIMLFSYILGALSLTSLVSSTGILLPLYSWPEDDSTWSPVYEAATAHPDILFQVIINPSSGPGDTSKVHRAFNSGLH
jgi:hypothetical protein